MKARTIACIISAFFILLFFRFNNGYKIIKIYPQLTQKTFSSKYYNKVIFYTGYLTSTDFTYDEYIYNNNIMYLQRQQEVFSDSFSGGHSDDEWENKGDIEKYCTKACIDNFKINDKDFKTFLYDTENIYYLNIQKSFLSNKNLAYTGATIYPNQYGDFIGNVRYYYKYLYKGEKVTVLCKINKNNEIIPYNGIFEQTNFFDTKLFN